MNPKASIRRLISEMKRARGGDRGLGLEAVKAFIGCDDKDPSSTLATCCRLLRVRTLSPAQQAEFDADRQAFLWASWMRWSGNTDVPAWTSERA